MNRWVVRIKHTAHGWAIPIPDEVLTLAGWHIGQAVEVSVTPSGAIVLMRPAASRGEEQG